MAFSIGALITFVIVLLAAAALVWLVFYVLDNFPPPEPLNRIIRVAIVVIAVIVVIIMLLNFAGVGTGVQVTS